MTQVMHLPADDSTMTVCGLQWQTYLLLPGSVWPICPDCWAGGTTPVGPGTIEADHPEVPQVLHAYAERLDTPREIE